MIMIRNWSARRGSFGAGDDVDDKNNDITIDEDCDEHNVEEKKLDDNDDNDDEEQLDDNDKILVCQGGLIRG